MILYGLKGEQYQIEDKPFGSGGEGDIYKIAGMDDQVVKVYRSGRTSEELQEKIKAMIKRPPSSSVFSQVAWPLDAVYDYANHFCGFVMPKLNITAELNEVYVYPPKTGITYKQKLILAQNICVVIHEVHKAGYVFGDFNPRNIGINMNTGAVAFLDTDSYHIVIDKKKNKAYRCNVCAPGYAAPELLSRCSYHISAHPEDKWQAYAKAPLDTFTKETDNFALAIHMFRLLMNGFTPFNGISENESASVGSPGVGDVAVRRDNYCFKAGKKPQSAAVPPLDILPEYVQNLFTRAFIEGRNNPEKRPSAIEWYKALEGFEGELVSCAYNPAHMYRRGILYCPWCEADEKYAMAIAPKVKQKAFTASAATPVTPAPVAATPAASSSRQPAVSNKMPPQISAVQPSGSSGSGNAASQHQSQRYHYNLFEIIFLSFMIGASVTCILLLLNLGLFYFTLSTYKFVLAGMWGCPVLFNILFLFSGAEESRASIVYWLCASMLTFFTCLVLWVGHVGGQDALLCWLAVAAAGGWFCYRMIGMFEYEKVLVGFLIFILFFIVFGIGTFVDLRVMNGGPAAVSTAMHWWLVGPSIIVMVAASGVTVKEMIG